jgi:hypothetical protein
VERHLVGHEGVQLLLHGMQLAAADPGERPGVEHDQRRLAPAQVREAYRLAVLVLELEVRGLVADGERHARASSLITSLAGWQCVITRCAPGRADER